MTAGERPSKPGELCTCGRPAVKVYATEKFGDVGYCGIPDGGRRIEEAKRSLSPADLGRSCWGGLGNVDDGAPCLATCTPDNCVRKRAREARP